MLGMHLFGPWLREAGESGRTYLRLCYICCTDDVRVEVAAEKLAGLLRA